jgi:GT2 family glycosyltransferase
MISVIIVNYHSAHLTKRAVFSVISDDMVKEIFVVDNTATPAEQQELQHIMPDRVHLIFNKSNEGFARACNKAYASSSGQYILLLNPDAYFLPGSVGLLKIFLDENPLAGAVGPRTFWDRSKMFFLPPSLFPSALSQLCGQAGRNLFPVAPGTFCARVEGLNSCETDGLVGGTCHAETFSS